MKTHLAHPFGKLRTALTVRPFKKSNDSANMPSYGMRLLVDNGAELHYDSPIGL
jgi:hypothetical protein